MAESIKTKYRKCSVSSSTSIVTSSGTMLKARWKSWSWVLAVEGMKFSAVMASLYATECNIPMELKERIIDDHLSKLLKNKLIALDDYSFTFKTL